MRSMMSAEIKLVCLLSIGSLLFDVRRAEIPDAVARPPGSDDHRSDAVGETENERRQLENLQRELQHLKEEFVKCR